MIPEATTLQCMGHATDDDWPRPTRLTVSPDGDSRNYVEVSIGYLHVSVPAADLIAAINKARGDQ